MVSLEERGEFKPICEDFNEMAHQLKISTEKNQKNEANRKELITSISHDLRSPLTSIKAFVEGMIDDVADTPEKQLEYLQVIKMKTDEINSMVSKLFLFSKMDMGSFPYQPEQLDIGREISDYVTAATPDYNARGLSIQISAMPGSKTIYADPVLLRNVFVNILDNSAKYKQDDTGHVHISCSATEDFFRIVFRDDGPGVPQDALEKLFDIFYRDDPSRSNPQQGSGLGLAISKKVLDYMGGKIYAESSGATGLSIILEVPETEA